MIGMTVLGTNRLIGRLIAGIASIGDGDDITLLTAEYVQRYAMDFVAYDTGKTHDNIRIEKTAAGHDVIADRGGDKPKVPAVLEYGGERVARPFMQPAIDLVVNTNAIGADIRTTGGLLK